MYTKYTPQDISRFWSKVKVAGSNECWLWQAGTNDQGYGTFRLGNMNRAHRVSFEITNGPIPEGLDVLHTCDNPPCVNPHHLWLGTNLDNVIDRETKQRGNHPRGESHGRAKLTEEQARYIRASFECARVLATRFRISKTQVKDIKNKRAWKHIE